MDEETKDLQDVIDGVAAEMKRRTGVGEIHCDFCDVIPDTPKRYACKSFTVAVIERGVSVNVMNSIADWCACPPCAALIDASDLEGLTDRSLAAEAPPEEDAEMRLELRRFLRVQFETFLHLRLEVPCS
jgi:hypothetical protein